MKKKILESRTLLEILGFNDTKINYHRKIRFIEYIQNIRYLLQKGNDTESFLARFHLLHFIYPEYKAIDYFETNFETRNDNVSEEILKIIYNKPDLSGLLIELTKKENHIKNLPSVFYSINQLLSLRNENTAIPIFEFPALGISPSSTPNISPRKSDQEKDL